MKNLYKTYALVFFMCLFVNTVCRAQEIARIEAWTVDQSKPSARSIYITRGESLWIQPTVTYQGPWTFPSNASVVMRYKSSDMTNLYYAVTGSVYTATSGILRVLWTPAQEATAKSYSFEIQAATGTVNQIAISGSIFLKDSLTTMSVVSNPPVNVYWPTVYTDTTARANADYATNWIATNVPSAVDATARATANFATNWIATNVVSFTESDTNALAQLRIETNRAIIAEAGINATATNALNQGTNSLALALANATPSGVSNIIASVASTGTYHFASTAGGLAITNGYVNLTIVGDVMTIIKTTNTASVIVTATNGAGYNGPPVGTVWASPTLSETSWVFPPQLDGTYVMAYHGVQAYPLNESTAWSVWPPEEGASYETGDNSSVVVLPVVIPHGPGPVSLGSLTLDWVPHTTTNTYDLSRFVTGTPWRADGFITNAAGSTITNLWAGPATSQSVTNAGTVYFTW